MSSINLGRVGFVLRGTWSSGATYNPLDVVLYNGTSYAAKTTSTGLAPSAASAAWQELTQISSAVSSGIANSAVRYDAAQSLTAAQKAQAQANMGISDAIAGMAVRYDAAQSLNATQKAQALANAGGARVYATDSEGNTSGMMIKY